MDWKEFKESFEVEGDDGETTTDERIVKYLCNQNWLSDCRYEIEHTPLGWRGSFEFKDSEAYILTHSDLDRVKKFCSDHLNQIKTLI